MVTYRRGPVLTSRLCKHLEMQTKSDLSSRCGRSWCQPPLNKLPLELHVPVTRIAEIVHERRGITPETALRLGRYFNTSARFWLNAQAAYELEAAQDELQDIIERDVKPLTNTSHSSRL